MGETMADASSWLRLPTIFADVTESDEPKEAFGFTMDEVGALGATLALDLQAELAPIWTRLDRQEGERILYCPSDVLSMARDMLEGRHSAASADFRFVALEPVRPPTPADNQMLFGDLSEPFELMAVDCEPELPDYQILEGEDDDESDKPMPEFAAAALVDDSSPPEHAGGVDGDVLPSMIESMTLSSSYDQRH